MEQTEQNLPLELQKTQLKVQALLQTTSELHNQIAEYRAEVTMLSEALNQARAALEAAEQQAPEASDEPVEAPSASGE